MFSYGLFVVPIHIEVCDSSYYDAAVSENTQRSFKI